MTSKVGINPFARGSAVVRANRALTLAPAPEYSESCEYYVDFRDGNPVPRDEEWVEGFDYSGDVRVYCEAPATVRIAGERDSWGTEWMYFCAGCAVAVREEMRAEEARRRTGTCAGCQKEATDRAWYYDASSCGCGGSCCGAYLCRECRRAEARRLEEEYRREIEREDDCFHEGCPAAGPCRWATGGPARRW